MVHNPLSGNKKQLRLNQINPYIRRASKHNIEGGFKTGTRINRHYQLHYICSGKGRFTFEGRLFDAREGDFFIWGPEVVHSIESDTACPLKVIGIQFDMTWNFCHLEYPCIHYNKDTFDKSTVHELITIEGIEVIPYKIHTYHTYKIRDYLEDVIDLYKTKSPYHLEIMSALLHTVIILSLESKENHHMHKGCEKATIQDIVQYFGRHYNERMTNAELGHMFNYHPNHLNQMVLEYTGKTIQQYLMGLRINRAMDLLQNTNRSISDIADEVGGYTIHCFSRIFKQKIGVSPSRFRQ